MNKYKLNDRMRLYLQYNHNDVLDKLIKYSIDLVKSEKCTIMNKYAEEEPKKIHIISSNIDEDVILNNEWDTFCYIKHILLYELQKLNYEDKVITYIWNHSIALHKDIETYLNKLIKQYL